MASFDVVVVGGGPAGMACASTAHSYGLSVLLIDERPALGGQIFKRISKEFVPVNTHALGWEYRYGQQLITSVLQSGVQVMLNASVLSYEDNLLVVAVNEAIHKINARSLVVAAGAFDRPVMFPGWTLAGVYTAGGLQSLVKIQGVSPGDRIFFAGSGPVVWSFASQLAKFGVNLVKVIDAGPKISADHIRRLLENLTGNWKTAFDAARYFLRLKLSRIPLEHRKIVVAAKGKELVESVVYASVDDEWNVIPGTEKEEQADVLCIGYGFCPSTELLQLAGCMFSYQEDLGGPIVLRDEWMRTTAPYVYAVGDCAGVRGALAALEEGTIAGIALALDHGRISLLQAKRLSESHRKKLHKIAQFQQSLYDVFHVNKNLYKLATDETIICRCEEVQLSEIKRALEFTRDLSSIKGITRAGMGYCQGRYCSRFLQMYLGAGNGSIDDFSFITPRPPLRPTPIRALADDSIEDPGKFVL